MNIFLIFLQVYISSDNDQEQNSDFNFENEDKEITDNKIISENSLDDFEDLQEGKQQIENLFDQNFRESENEQLETSNDLKQIEQQPIENALNPKIEGDCLKKYFEISGTMDFWYSKYLSCFEEIEDEDFSYQNIFKCTGDNHLHLKNNMDYEKRKLMSWADKSLTDVFVNDCYLQAGEDLEASEACDVLKEDVLILLWNELPIMDLIEMHKNKYSFNRVTMDDSIFANLSINISELETEYKQLLEEINNHSEIILQKLTKYIKERVDDITDLWKRGEFKHYPNIRQDFIKMEEIIPETDYYKLEFNENERKLGLASSSKNEKDKITSGSIKNESVSKWSKIEKKYDRKVKSKEFPKIPFARDKNLKKKISKLDSLRLKKDRFQFFDQK